MKLRFQLPVAGYRLQFPERLPALTPETRT